MPVLASFIRLPKGGRFEACPASHLSRTNGCAFRLMAVRRKEPPNGPYTAFRSFPLLSPSRSRARSRQDGGESRIPNPAISARAPSRPPPVTIPIRRRSFRTSDHHCRTKRPKMSSGFSPYGRCQVSFVIAGWTRPFPLILASLRSERSPRERAVSTVGRDRP